MIKKGSSVFFTLRAKKTKVDDDNLEIATLLFDTGRYEGQVKDGKANGKGMFIWKDSSKYNGEWKDNYRHGRGVYLCTDGTKVSEALLSFLKNKKCVLNFFFEHSFHSKI